jgi:hypothetical protein
VTSLGSAWSSALDLDPEEAQTRFDSLQRKLVPLWRSIERLSDDEQTIVVVPSLSVDLPDMPASVLQAYEERYLFLLLLLRQPRARLVYVSSLAVNPGIVEYYLDLLPGVVPAHARRRLFLVSPLDGSARPLSEKLLERPRLIERIRELVADPDRAHIVPFTTTELERDLALALGIPMYGADPRFWQLGTKSGGRRLFAEEGVPHPLGRENMTSAAEVTKAVAAIREQRPGVERAIVKLNDGVAGKGNASCDLRGLPRPGDPGEEAAIDERLRGMDFEQPGLTFERYASLLVERGGIVEERIDGAEMRSPSVQLRVTPLGKLEVLSTHDQLLGGPSGQSYLGCRFPADRAYAAAITKEASKVGERLAREGVLGRFALDFVVVKRPAGGWEPYAIELNLRKGGTTHPFLTLQFLTDGIYDPERGIFTALDGRPKCFVASDCLESRLYRSLTPDDLFEIAIRRGLHFHRERQTGVVFHMMSALGEYGRTGLTAVGERPEEADTIYRRAVAVLDEEAAAAAAGGLLDS